MTIKELIKDRILDVCYGQAWGKREQIEHARRHATLPQKERLADPEGGRLYRWMTALWVSVKDGQLYPSYRPTEPIEPVDVEALGLDGITISQPDGEQAVRIEGDRVIHPEQGDVMSVADLVADMTHVSSGLRDWIVVEEETS